MDSGQQKAQKAVAMTTEQLQEWLRNWVIAATGLPAEEITDDQPMQAFGLSSRDVVLLSGELENLLDTQLDATIAYEYPTIAALAKRLVEGEPAPRLAAGNAPALRSVSTTPGTHDVAIVGIAAKYPGAENVEQMWNLLVEGRDAITEPPLGRWSEYAADEVMSKRMAEQQLLGGYLEDLASFDAEFFGLSPLEAVNIDPQQRLMLELSWEALENAGIPANTLRGKSVGVFVGSTNNDYGMLIFSDPSEAHPYALTGNSSAVVANRVSYAFDFRGPSIQVDTACSSSLVSVHQAVRALRDGEADVALAGGVNVMATPAVTTSFGELGVLSPTGKIHAFSDDADGFVRSDGAGMLVLKRVDDAIAAGDNILAVIKGSAVNSDGHSNGITAPNPDAQVDVLQRAYADANVDPTTVDYVEAHGTGTILGDPIEASAIGAVLGRGREITRPTLLGSAKTNFGHTESAAGAAGLIKVVLSMQNRTLPPSLNYVGPNRYVDFDAERLEVVEDPREWPQYSGRMVAGVSGFGFGGTNAHVVLSEFVAADYPTSPTSPANPANGADGQERTAALESAPALLPISGLLPSRRREAAASILAYLSAHEDADVHALARTLGGRNHGRSRAAIVARTHEEAVKGLGLVAEGKTGVGIAVADSPAAQGPVFVYSGFGSQHRLMVKQLVASSAQFRARLEELDQIVQFESGWSILDLVADDEQTYNTETAQVAITAIQIALTDLLAALGVKPAAVAGMSMGEIAAAYASGGLSAEDAMKIAAHRSRLMGEGEQSLPEDQLGAMAVVEFSVEALDTFIQEHPDFAGIEPAVYAGPGMTTVGGPREAVIKLVETLEAEEKFARLLNVKGAGHTSAVEPLLGELAFEIADITPRPLTIPLFSSVDRGITYTPGQQVHTPEYFLRCTRQPVWFQDAIEAGFAAGHNTFVEVSPNPVALMGMMNTAFSVGKPDAQLLFTLKRKEDEPGALVDLLAKLYANGAPVDFAELYGPGDKLPVPGMPWKKQRYWTAARPSSGARGGLPGTKIVLPDGAIAFGTVADQVPSAVALLEAAVHEVQPEAQLIAVEDKGTLPPTGELTTVARRVAGGVAVQVFAVLGEVTTQVAEGFASVAAAPAAVVATNAEQHADPVDVVGESMKWDPASGESVEQRMRSIVSEAMGYDVEDLPRELPLIDLGLDSLMGMRIKNRIEHDFQIPPLQVQALRDASVADVVKLVEDLVVGRAPTDAPKAETQQDAGGAAAGGGAGGDAPAPAPTPAPTPSVGVGVAPRDASERLVFATWAGITGAAAAGVTSELPAISEQQALEIAQRLTERAGIEVSQQQVLEAQTLEPLANLVREGLETDVEGNIRVLRARKEGSTAPAVFMFHPAGGSSVVYQPLMRRLPEEVPVYGVERLEGSLEDRAAQYLDEIKQYSDGLPIVLGGWSFGGALAYEVAYQLRDSDVEVATIALLDTVQPAHPAPDTMEETKARWGRYQAFAKKTYGLDFPVPYELLETAGEDALLAMMGEFLANTDASEHGLSAGVLEHQRASFVDNRILDRLNLHRWDQVDVPVILFRAERMHDGAVELEPAYAEIAEDGGWSAIVDDLEIVHLKGDHLAVVDEPEIAKVGSALTRRIEQLRS
ncbi:polyketide synthase Pks13 [Corynebacterium sp. 153RC1]|uniref:polyketide synthase Pks13 n=1 Tax=unclassified Corynebacterium TaxID=2624378 RepID=UPI00211B9D64|nr:MULTISPECIES: polyketide synthase Pks13 [unclassified Corynebacterium]MCQ9352690.1 polyketide synthase Pks13 [Corynebacterium sp. 209RC1]MCQ9354874.1 polyketide synthase Pks13 [Corynebacterium sp. 1222RC1]MCQ9357059.1 polyketide synthase Pks13 [Corynebacterium sp. 122RC1]MCQ9359305.1 polyketide synthase Pks13 [Corynebacterium sp. 142RC1]MCQ9361527.1 polyketide synthase Pks13 [Corynebacterium sp. 153RC1]